MRGAGRGALFGLVALAVVPAIACTPQASRGGAGAGPSAVASAEAGASAAAGGASADAGAEATLADLHAADAGSRAAEPEPEPAPTFDEVLTVLFAEKTSSAPVVAACPVSLPRDARVRCLYDERYRGDAKAAGIAHDLLVKWHTVAGVEVAHTMDGGYRGMIRIEPAVPVGENRKHLEYPTKSRSRSRVTRRGGRYRGGPGTRATTPRPPGTCRCRPPGLPRGGPATRPSRLTRTRPARSTRR